MKLIADIEAGKRPASHGVSPRVPEALKPFKLQANQTHRTLGVGRLIRGAITIHGFMILKMRRRRRAHQQLTTKVL